MAIDLIGLKALTYDLCANKQLIVGDMSEYADRGADCGFAEKRPFRSLLQASLLIGSFKDRQQIEIHTPEIDGGDRVLPV